MIVREDPGQRPRIPTTSRDGLLDLLIIGPYPPPQGGISTHIERLSALLTRNGLDIRVKNYFGHSDPNPPVVASLHRDPLRHWLAARSPGARALHYHHSRVACLLAVAFGRRHAPSTRFILTVHGQELAPYLRLPLVRSVIAWAIRRFDRVISVGPEVSAPLAPLVQAERLSTLPAYLPPPPLDSTSRLPVELERFLDQPGHVLVVSAYRLRSRDGADLYGLGFAADIFRELAKTMTDLRLAIFLGKAPKGLRNRRWLRSLLDRVDPKRTSKRVMVCQGLPLWAALRRTNVIYLRPTESEGDAVSVREALDAGRPVIASDVVARPSGVATLPLGARDQWREAILSAGRKSIERPRSMESDSVSNAYLDLYRSVLS